MAKSRKRSAAARSAAARKAWRTRRVNALELEYQAQTSAGKKAAIRRQINQILSESE